MTAQVEALNIVYTGKALDTHKMDILALAQSLKGLGEALYEANVLLNGDEKFEVNVDAELIAGSFGFQLQVVQHLNNAKDVLKLFGLKASKIIVGESTVLEVLEKLDGRKIDIVETDKSSGKVKLLVDGEEIVCSQDVEKIVNSPEIRKAVDSFIRQPLLKEGIEGFVVKPSKDSTDIILEVKKENADNFKSPRVLFETKEEDDESETTVTFLSADIEKKTGWRVMLNKEPRTVRMEDEEFMLRLKSKDTPNIFGDLYAVTIQKKVKNTGGDVTESLKIVKVGRRLGGKKS
ncbi:hypothetical protein ACSVOC_19635 [Salmonella enterica]|uniref:hypothetical protein n=1 Tax=Salmonella enterica TaxID=28901 RepID=UPI001271401A|nr:hypothetical protein [Salmonella enterica]EBG0543873.1 hypothetical protein [Salmonella enterica subsp. enterica serovar Ank]EBS1404871.1 hypothetical protein [Salmonella enterica subsp. enterica serovar Reading]EBV0313226.1 hypothetical protein [Salmonella enterica subsp. enterica serovar Oranienburg]EBX4347446.1 hypothetical protein [Salmonella enterica subsp. enterica serovar Halle]ECB6804108.1 hypothetical protein [Salmonella enterica subsp. enterica serovar Gambia]EEF3437798.1 hypothe